MDFSAHDIESIVRRVLGNLGGAASAPAGDIPKTAKVAMLTAAKTIEVKELLSITSMLSTSFVKRLMISPVGWLSKYLTGSFCKLLKRSSLIALTEF